VLRQTMRKRLQAKLGEVKAELKRRRHTPIQEQGIDRSGLLRVFGRVASCCPAASLGPDGFELAHPVLLFSADSDGNIQDV